MFRRLFSALRLAPARTVFISSFAVQLLILVRLAQSMHFLPGSDDMKFYHDWALRIAGGQWTDHQAFYGLPGYAYLVALIYLLVGKMGTFLVVVFIGGLQALLSAGVATLLYQLARLIFAPASGETGSLSAARPHVIGGLAAIGWTCFTPAQAFGAILMPTVWLVFSYYLCVFLAAQPQRTSWWSPWGWLGLGCGLVAMLVATILFALPLLVFAIILRVECERPLRERWPRVLAAAALLVAGVVAGAAPAWAHNYLVAREPVALSAHSGINFWIGNNPVATGYPKMPPGLRATQEGLLRDSITLAEEAAGRRLTRAEVSRYWSEKADAYIRENRPAWRRLMLVKFGNFWNAYQYDDLSIIKLLRDEQVLPPGLRWGFVAALGLAGMCTLLRRFPRARWVAAAVLLHMAAVLTVFITERYRLAAVPGLLLLGAGGLWSAWEMMAHGKWMPVGGYAAVASTAAFFVSIPRQDLSLWSLDHYKAGIRATDAGDLDRAQRNLETAYAYVQTNADINFALGNLWLARSSSATDERDKATFRARAKSYYRTALELNPSHSGTLNNLGVLALEEQRFELAEKFFSGALVTEPEAAKTHYLLARARFEAGRFVEARKALTEALRLRPRQREFLELQEKLRLPPSQSAGPGAVPAQ